MKYNIVNWTGATVGEISLPQIIFDYGVRKDLMYKVLHWQLAKSRSGTHAVKERGDVRGSTRKISPQKGRGAARHGGIRGAQFRGGGIIFGPQVRSHGYKLNKKVRFLGLCSAICMRFSEMSIFIMEDLKIESTKTSEFLKLSQHLIGGSSALLVDNDVPSNIRLASSNVVSVNTIPVYGLNVRDILKHKKVFLTINAVEYLANKAEAAYAF